MQHDMDSQELQDAAGVIVPMHPHVQKPAVRWGEPGLGKCGIATVDEFETGVCSNTFAHDMEFKNRAMRRSDGRAARGKGRPRMVLKPRCPRKD